MLSQGFSILPAELVLLLMTHLETPRELFAFVRTCHRTHQIFKQTRSVVLAAVIRNAIPKENLGTAIAACRVGEISRLWWAKDSPAAIAERQAEFLKDYARGYAYDDIFLQDWNLQQSVCKLWWVCDYFQSCYEQDALKFALKNVPLLRNQCDSRLTSSEKIKLQRAFFRFEVYRRLNPATMSKSRDTPTSVYRLITDFVKCFSPWEREELLSVQEFLVEYARNLCRSLQDYIVREICVIAQETVAAYSTIQQPFEKESIQKIRMILDLERLDVFQHNLSTERRFQYFVARGLPFLRWLSKLSPQDRIEAVIHHSLGKCSLSFFEALSCMHMDMSTAELDSFNATSNWMDEALTGRVKGPNEGWAWASRHSLIVGEDSLRKRFVLRKMGYIFWDTTRLNGNWQLQLTDPSMIELPPRSQDDDGRDWGEEPGITERFKDLEIPKGVLLVTNEAFTSRLFASETMMQKVENGYPTPFSDHEARLFNIEY